MYLCTTYGHCNIRDKSTCNKESHSIEYIITLYSSLFWLTPEEKPEPELRALCIAAPLQYGHIYAATPYP